MMLTPSPSSFVRFDVDRLLDRLLAGRFGLDRWYQEAFSLTALDPRRLSPPIESADERLDNMRAVCETHGVNSDIVRSLEQRGFRSVTQLSLLPPGLIQDLALCEEERRPLEAMVNMLDGERRPLEPLYSLKRLMHHRIQDAHQKRARGRIVDYLDPATEYGRPESFGEKFQEAFAVQRKLLIATFGEERWKKDIPIRKAIPEQEPSSGITTSANLSPTLAVKKSLSNKKFQHQQLFACQNCSTKFWSTSSKRMCRPCWASERTQRPSAHQRRLVMCQNYITGCHVVGAEPWVARHMKQECVFAACCCPWIGCSFRGATHWMSSHLEYSHTPIEVSVPWQSPSDSNRLASGQLEFLMQVVQEGFFPRPGNYKQLAPLYWEPKRFVFDNINFFQMLYRQSYQTKGCNGKTVSRARFYFWIWAMVPPKLTEKYYYTIRIPSATTDCGDADFFTRPFLGQAMPKSLQEPLEGIIGGVKHSGPRGVVCFEEKLLQKNILINGYFTYHLRIVKA